MEDQISSLPLNKRIVIAYGLQGKILIRNGNTLVDLIFKNLNSQIGLNLFMICYFYYRHKLYYATLALKPGSRAVITDVCVPISRLPDILLETRKDIDATGIIGWLFSILSLI